MPQKLTYQLTLAGLAILSIVFPWWLNVSAENLGLLWAIGSGCIVPLLLLLACAKRTRNWAGITALCMIPLAAIGMMEIVATLGKPDAGMALGVISIGVFFTALDAGRRYPG